MVLAFTLSACGGSSSPTAPAPASAASSATATSLAIWFAGGGAYLTGVGQTSQLGASATLSSGTTQLVTATWQSSNVAVAKVSTIGLVTAVGLGTAVIGAAYQGKSASQQVSVGATSQGQISSCGAFIGAGPFTVAADIKITSTDCLTFSGSVSAQLDCKGHDVSSVTLSSVQGFAISNCQMHAGLLKTLQVLNSGQVTVDGSDILGAVDVESSQGTTLSHSTFRWPVVPANTSVLCTAEVLLHGGQGHTIIQSTVDGGWDGNLATYEQQGCDDGIIMTNATNSVIQGDTVLNVYDAGIEAAGTTPLTATIEGNTISHVGFTGIGGYYVAGWQNSIFSGNTVTNGPSLMVFTQGSSSSGISLMTLVNNQITNNTLQNPVLLPPANGGGASFVLRIDYVTGGLPYNVNGNLIQGNNFGTSATTRPPYLTPIDGFIDGGGNTCLPGGSLACLGVLVAALRAPVASSTFKSGQRRHFSK